jgi:hypothetical protein
MKALLTAFARWSTVICCIQATPGASRVVHRSLGRRVHLPPASHATRPPDAARPRTIVVGDVHGCLAELKALLLACEYDPATTRVVLVGDLVNKGPHSVETLRYVRSSGFASVRGNHDDAALFGWEARQDAAAEGTAVGADDKYAYTDAFTPDDLAFLRGLPYTITLPEHRTIVVHAGLVPQTPLHEQSPTAM